MIILEDILNKMKAQNEIGTDAYKNARNYVLNSWNKKDQDGRITLGVKRGIQDISMIKGAANFYDTITAISSAFTAMMTVGCFTEEDIFKYMAGTVACGAGAISAYIRGKQFKNAYKIRREDVKKNVFDSSEDHRKNHPIMMSVDEMDEIRKQKQTFDGSEYSEFVTDTILTDVANEIIKDY